MKLDRGRPEILTPPPNPPACCQQQTITVGPDVCAKTQQKPDYPSAAHRRSYARRTGAERTFATIKDTATTSIARGWCRLTGLTPLYLWLACLLTVRNQRILDAHSARQAGNARRAAAGLPPETRSAAARPSPASPPARPNKARQAHAAAHPPNLTPSTATRRTLTADKTQPRRAPARTRPAHPCRPHKCQTQT